MKAADFLERTHYKLFPPKAAEVDSVKTWGFSHDRYKVKAELYKNPFVICPMQSGKKALLKLHELKIAHDPDDFYSVEWKLIYYIE